MLRGLRIGGSRGLRGGCADDRGSPDPFGAYDRLAHSLFFRLRLPPRPHRRFLKGPPPMRSLVSLSEQLRTALHVVEDDASAAEAGKERTSGIPAGRRRRATSTPVPPERVESMSAILKRASREIL